MAGWGSGVGGFIGGLAQGINANRDQEFKRQELELKKQQIQAQQKLLEANEQERNLKVQQSLRQMMLQGQLDQTFSGQVPGQQGVEQGSYGAQGEAGPFKSPEVAGQEKGAKIKEILTRMYPEKFAAQASQPSIVDQIRDYRMGQSLLNEPQGGPQQAQGAQQAPMQPQAPMPQPQISIGPKGATIRTPSPERAPLGADSKLWARLEHENQGATTEELRRLYNAEIKKTASARGAGGQQGALGVRQSPEYLQNATDVATARTAGAPIPESADVAITSMRTILQQLDRIDPNKKGGIYSDKYVGPFASRMGGVRETLGETPVIGRFVGGPIDVNESQFRQAVNSVYNEIANLRGGKVLPEQELKRIEKEAATLTESPTTFKSRHAGFKTMVEAMLRNRISNVGATRSTVGGGAAAPRSGGGLPQYLIDAGWK